MNRNQRINCLAIIIAFGASVGVLAQSTQTMPATASWVAHVLGVSTNGGNETSNLVIDAPEGAQVLIEGYALSTATGAAPASVKLLLTESSRWDLTPPGGVPGNGIERKVIPASYFTHPEAIRASNTTQEFLLTAENTSALSKSGFYWLIDTRMLPTGLHRFTHLEIVPTGSTTPVRVALQRGGEINVMGASAATTNLPPVTLTGINGNTQTATALPTLVSRGTARSWNLQGYAALKDGEFSLTLPAVTRYGVQSSASVANVTIRYERPVLKLNVPAPNVTGLDGISQSFALTNPATGQPMTDTVQAAVLPDGVSILIDGQPASGDTRPIPYVAAMRSHAATIGFAQPGTARLWIDAPDAPTLELTSQVWEPSAALTPRWKDTTAVVRLQPVVVGFTQDRSKGGCANSPVVFTGALPELTRVRPGQIECAARIVNVPAGLAALPEASGFAGKLTAAAAHSIEYQPGIVHRKASGEIAFYPQAGSAAVLAASMVAVNQAPLNFTFAPASQFRTITGTRTGLLTGVGQNVTAGELQVDGVFSGLELSVARGSAASSSSQTTSTRARKLLSTSIDDAGSSETLTVSAWYKDTPDVINTKTYEFTAVGVGLVLSMNTTNFSSALSTTPTTISGLFGVRTSTTTWGFTSTTHGDWQLSFERYDVPSRAWVALTSTQNIAADGTWSMQLPALQKGKYTVRTKAVLLDNSSLAQQIETRNTLLTINDGSTIEGTVVATPSSGPASTSRPLAVRLTATLPAGRASDAEAVRWQVQSAQGWQDLQGRGASIYLSLTGGGATSYRAVFENIFTDAITYSEGVVVDAFEVPALEVTAPGVMLAGSEVGRTLVATVAGSRAAQIDWLITRPDRSAYTAQGDQVTIVAPAGVVGSYAVTVKASWVGDAEASTDARRVAVRETRVTSTPAKPPLPTIVSAPNRWELGRSYQVTANPPTLSGALQPLANSLQLAWVLPDGSAQPVTAGASQSVTFTAVTQTLRLRAWFTATPAEVSEAILRPTLWEYNFPSAWSIQARSLDSMEAPTRVALTVVPNSTPALGPGESISLQWAAGVNDLIESSSGYSAVVRITEAGQRTLSVTLSDSRGAVRNAAATLTVEPPKDRLVSLIATSSDPLMQAPLEIALKPKVISWPKAETIHALKIFANDVKLFEGAWAGTIPTYRVPVTSPGAVTIRMVYVSSTGAEVAATQQVQAVVATAPVCSIRESTPLADRTTYQAVCSRVGSQSNMFDYQWRLSNDVNAPTVSSGSTVSLRNGTPGTKLYLWGCADKGGCATANVTTVR